MEEPKRITRTLQAFRERGVRIALDDFGTGYSSLNYLRSLPLDILKIDRSFVSEIGSVRTGSPLVRAILSMAEALQLTCVAEGIETRSQLEFLTRLGCPEAQGYLIARPMSADSLDAWVAERTARALSYSRRHADLPAQPAR